jgi:molybdate transport system substrate-binding protein
MNRKRILLFLGTALMSLLIAAGFQAIGQSPTAQSNTRILVSAAVSLKDALEEIKPLYQQSKANVGITFNFGASGALQQQIEQGAPVDVFISAAKKQMDALEQKGMLVLGTRSNLVTNRLVLIVPSNSTAVINRFADLTKANVRRIAIGEPRSVPAGQYAEQVFRKLGIANQLKPKLVLANNVRQVLAAVETGNADAGIVYVTDAKTTNKVKVMATANPQDHAPIWYPIAVLKRSKNVNAVKDFVRYLFNNSAQAILRKHGFSR